MRRRREVNKRRTYSVLRRSLGVHVTPRAGIPVIVAAAGA